MLNKSVKTEFQLEASKEMGRMVCCILRGIRRMLGVYT